MPTSTPQIVTRLVQLGESANPADNFFLRAEGDGALSITRCSDGRVAALIGADNKVTFPGNAQTWQNVVTSRALNTPYTNDTHNPIKVSIFGSCSVDNAFAATIDGVPYSVIGSIAYAAGKSSNIYFEVPAGKTYSVTAPAGALSYWRELR